MSNVGCKKLKPEILGNNYDVMKSLKRLKSIIRYKQLKCLMINKIMILMLYNLNKNQLNNILIRYVYEKKIVIVKRNFFQIDVGFHKYKIKF